MDFTNAIRTCFEKYATFRGRARRPEFWWFVLFAVLGSAALQVVDRLLFGWGGSGPEPLSSLFGLAILLPYLAVAARRLHDTDRTGWWLLIGLIPILGILVLIYFCIRRGTRGDNRFGHEPAP